MLKKLGKAFITGGCIGVVGQILISVAGLVLPDPSLAMMAGMLLFGFLSIGLIVSGAYFKIGAFGSESAQIPLCGLMFGAAMGAAAAQKNGAAPGMAILLGILGILKVLGTGYLICLILGLLLH